MRHIIPIPAALLGLALACAPAAAQVSFDPRALAPLQPQAAAPAPTPPAAPPANNPAASRGSDSTRPPPVRRATPQRPAPTRRPALGAPEAAKPDATRPAATATTGSAATHGAANPATTVRGASRPGMLPGPPSHPTDSRTVTVPKAPPLPVALPPPPVVVPARPPPPPTPVSVLPTAPGEALPMPGGARITFGPGQSDLNPATDAAIKELLHAAPRSDSTTFTVAAYAQGTPEDPSTARRLSLARALAVRSVLITEGVASVRIYVKALGPPNAALPQSQDGPPDRVDITVGAGAPAPQTGGGAPAPQVTGGGPTPQTANGAPVPQTADNAPASQATSTPPAPQRTSGTPPTVRGGAQPAGGSSPRAASKPP